MHGLAVELLHVTFPRNAPMQWYGNPAAAAAVRIALEYELLTAFPQKLTDQPCVAHEPPPQAILMSVGA